MPFCFFNITSIIFALKYHIQSSPCLYVRLDSKTHEERNHVLTVFKSPGYLEHASHIATIQEDSIVLLVPETDVELPDI